MKAARSYARAAFSISKLPQPTAYNPAASEDSNGKTRKRGGSSRQLKRRQALSAGPTSVRNVLVWSLGLVMAGRYLAEFDFRYNERIALGISDEARADSLVRGIVGKRLTYRDSSTA